MSVIAIPPRAHLPGDPGRLTASTVIQHMEELAAKLEAMSVHGSHDDGKWIVLPSWITRSWRSRGGRAGKKRMQKKKVLLYRKGLVGWMR